MLGSEQALMNKRLAQKQWGKFKLIALKISQIKVIFV